MKNSFESIIPTQRLMLDLMQTISLKTIEGTEKLIALQMQASRSMLEDAASQSQAFTDLKDPSKLVTNLTSMANPASEKLSSYARQAYEISNETRTAISETIQKHVQDSQQVTQAWFESASRTAPAGSEPIFAAARNALSVVKASIEQATKAGQQAAQFAEEQVIASTKPAARARKAA